MIFILMLIHPEETAMRTTIRLDSQLLSEAYRMTGSKKRTALVHAGLRDLIERESARRLELMDGSDPQLKPISRRRARGVLNSFEAWP